MSVVYRVSRLFSSYQIDVLIQVYCIMQEEDVSNQTQSELVASGQFLPDNVQRT